ncbi:DoxX family protein [Leifsonia kafniensis]|uniref:DoxX family protein n=2 Tax=Leifsonia kafniensis TaxID=475957 RepID=A0ABP7KAJ0_9MICO
MTPLDLQYALRVLLAALFVFMGVAHFRPGPMRTMAAMIPPSLRFQGAANPHNLVVLTGVCEIAGGLGLVFPPTSVAAGVCLIIFLIAVFPANAYAARHRERFGRAAIPLVPRLIGQLVLIALIVLAIM